MKELPKLIQNKKGGRESGKNLRQLKIFNQKNSEVNKKRPAIWWKYTAVHNAWNPDQRSTEVIFENSTFYFEGHYTEDFTFSSNDLLIQVEFSILEAIYERVLRPNMDLA